MAYKGGKNGLSTPLDVLLHPQDSNTRIARLLPWRRRRRRCLLPPGMGIIARKGIPVPVRNFHGPSPRVPLWAGFPGLDDAAGRELLPHEAGVGDEILTGEAGIKPPRISGLKHWDSNRKNQKLRFVCGRSICTFRFKKWGRQKSTHDFKRNAPAGGRQGSRIEGYRSIYGNNHA